MEDHRLPLLIDEIMGYNADIICLQEVDNKKGKYFQNFLSPRFALNNLEGVFIAKDKRSEGVATFYNRKRYKMLEI